MAVQDRHQRLPRRARGATRRGCRRCASYAEVPWLQPYPDRLLDEVAPTEDEPDAVVVARETIELAFLAVIQLLPPRQRAVLILRDVLGWSAKETADLLETTSPSANSALQRARATLQERLPPRRADRRAGELTDEERTLLAGFIDAHERADPQPWPPSSRDDIRITMPPHPFVYDGLEAIAPAGRARARPRHLAARPDQANRMPAAASYLRRPGRDRVPRVQARRPAGRGRRHRRDHDVRRLAVRRLRARAGPAVTAFERRAVVVAPGGALAFDAAEWRDALVTVEHGAIEAEPADGGAPVRFVRGDVLALDGRDLRALRNPGAGVAALMVVRRVGADGG